MACGEHKYKIFYHKIFQEKLLFETHIYLLSHNPLRFRLVGHNLKPQPLEGFRKNNQMKQKKKPRKHFI